jgi:hypothetical protein
MLRCYKRAGPFESILCDSQWQVLIYIRVCELPDPMYSTVGTTIAAIIALLVCSGENKVSTKDAFTMFENNTGWSDSKHRLCRI